MRSRVYFKLLTMSAEQWTWNFNDQKFWKRVSRKGLLLKMWPGFSKCDTVSWKSDPISWKCEWIFKNVPQFSEIVTRFSKIYDSLYDKKACRKTRISGSLRRFRVWCCLGPFDIAWSLCSAGMLSAAVAANDAKLQHTDFWPRCGTSSRQFLVYIPHLTPANPHLTWLLFQPVWPLPETIHVERSGSGEQRFF